MSDLHLEMESFRLAVPGWADFLARHKRVLRHPSRGPMLNDVGQVDLIVLAGDIHNGLRGIVYAEQVAEYLDAPVVMVAGNHEYYHHDIATLLPAFRETVNKAKRVYFLENSTASFTVNNGRKIKLLGCTLWTDFALQGDPELAMRNAQRVMNDYRFIDLQRYPLTPPNTREFHQTSLAWLHAELDATEPETARIVVSHHAPSGRVLGKRTGPIAPAYGSEITGQFSTKRLDLWIHGHTHFRHDSIIDGIRLVSAPRGYVGHDGQKALEFKSGIVEI